VMDQNMKHRIDPKNVQIRWGTLELYDESYRSSAVCQIRFIAGDTPMLAGELYDIAILILEYVPEGVPEVVEFPKRRPQAGEMLRIWGFGLDDYYQISEYLKSGYMIVQSDADCDELVQRAQNQPKDPKWWHWLVGKNVTGQFDENLSKKLPRKALFCTQSTAAVFCDGDSGGPITDGSIQYGMITNTVCGPREETAWQSVLVDLTYPTISMWLRIHDVNV